MPQTSQSFSAYPVSVVLDGSGNGAVAFQATGSNMRITNRSVRVSSSVAQAVATTYKNQVGDNYRLDGTNSGSTGDNNSNPVDLFDGESIIVVWTGGDPGATATATFSGKQLALSEVGEGEGGNNWSTPVAAGDGSLIYPAIKSPNYVTAIAGWIIKRNGDAEFNNIIARGIIRVDGADGSYVAINKTVFDQPQLELRPPNTTPPTNYDHNGTIVADTTNLGGGIFVPLITMRSPNFAGQLQGTLELFGQNSDGSGTPHLELNGADLGKGWVAGGGITANVAAVGATEVVAITAKDAAGNTPVFSAGRMYRVEIQGSAFTTAVGTDPLLRIRKLAAPVANGQQIDVWRATPSNPNAAGAAPAHWTSYFKVLGSDVTADIVATIASVAGQTCTWSASATGVGSINIYDEDNATSGQRTWVPILV